MPANPAAVPTTPRESSTRFFAVSSRGMATAGQAGPRLRQKVRTSLRSSSVSLLRSSVATAPAWVYLSAASFRPTQLAITATAMNTGASASSQRTNAGSSGRRWRVTTNR